MPDGPSSRPPLITLGDAQRDALREGLRQLGAAEPSDPGLLGSVSDSTHDTEPLSGSVPVCQVGEAPGALAVDQRVLAVAPISDPDQLVSDLRRLAEVAELLSLEPVAGLVVVDASRGHGEPPTPERLVDVVAGAAAQIGAIAASREDSFEDRERQLRTAVDDERQRARDHLDKARRLHAAELRDVRSSSRYVIGDVIVSGLRRPSSLRRAPARLREIYRDRMKPVPEEVLPDLDRPPRTDLVVGAILDEFSWNCFAPEARLLELDPFGWRDQLDDQPIDLLFVESAWRGNRGKWSYALNRFAQQDPNHVAELIERVGRSNTPAVFWNKEDPVGFETFIDAAAAFPTVLTTDRDVVPEYVERLGHSDVGALPFAAQPRLHNPIGSKSDVLPRVCFAGSWRGDKYEQRSSDFRTLLDPAIEMKALDIYDRYADHPDADKLGFPEPYRSAVVGSLPYPQMVEAYRHYSAFLNVNSVTESPTMFSRRVFELLACGTPVISTPSRGIEEMLGDHVRIVRNPSETADALQTLLWDTEAREREGHLGYRFVQRNHTYRERFAEIAATVGLDLGTTGPPSVTVVCVSNRPEHLAQALESYARQTYEPRELIFVGNHDGFDRDEVAARLQDLPRARALFMPEEATLAECLNAAIETADGAYIAKFDDDDAYGAEYLADMMLTFEYSGCPVAGKRSYYAYLAARDLTALRFPGNEFRRVSAVVGGTLVFERAVAEDIPFTPVAAGTDTVFLKECRAAGHGVFSADRYNFVQTRSGDPERHTWKIDDDEFLQVADTVGSGRCEQKVFV